MKGICLIRQEESYSSQCPPQSEEVSHIYAEKRNRYCLEVIKLDKDQGYGYTIKQGKQTVIYQPFVPVLSQRKPFNTPDEAAKVGDLVLERLESGQDFSVTEEDLKSLGIKK